MSKKVNKKAKIQAKNPENTHNEYQKRGFLKGECMRKYENVPVNQLIPYEKNARTHSEEQIERIMKSLKEFGFVNPVLIDQNYGVIAGHGRILAAKKMGLTEVPCIFIEDLTEEQKRAYIIADNKLALDACWDFEILKTELEDLEKLNFDISLTGFDIDELDFSTGNENSEVIDDEVPDIPKETKIKMGDIYQLGNHRLMCGDSTNIDDLKKLMNDKIVDITFTSPPYNAGKTPTESKMQRTTKYNGNNDDKTIEEYLKFLNDYLHNTMIFSKYSFMNIQSISNNKIALIELLHKNQNIYADTIIWDKMLSQPAMAENVLNSEFEYIHIFSPKGNRAIGAKQFRGTLKNIIHFQKQTKNEYHDIHNATFPLELALHFVENFSIESVLDPFGGTGTTLIACEKLDRKCYMMELEPKYCDVIVERWENFTGKKAVKIND